MAGYKWSQGPGDWLYDLPIIGDYLPLKNVIVCLAAVILIGKTVLDTLFYDHYRP